MDTHVSPAQLMYSFPIKIKLLKVPVFEKLVRPAIVKLLILLLDEVES